MTFATRQVRFPDWALSILVARVLATCRQIWHQLRVRCPSSLRFVLDNGRQLKSQLRYVTYEFILCMYNMYAQTYSWFFRLSYFCMYIRSSKVEGLKNRLSGGYFERSSLPVCSASPQCDAYCGGSVSKPMWLFNKQIWIDEPSRMSALTVVRLYVRNACEQVHAIRCFGDAF
jgi:hypothetical protein